MSELIDYMDLCKFVAKHTKESRYRHSVGVAHTASDLLERFTGDGKAGLYTGIFHDAYRYLDDDKMLKEAKKGGIDICEEEFKQPMLLHGAVAALHFEKVAGLCPTAWFKAMRHHTLGAVDMGVIGAALYVADYIEPSRKHITEEEKIEIKTEGSLEAMVLAILYREKNYFAESGKTMAGRTLSLLSFLEDGGKFEEE